MPSKSTFISWVSLKLKTQKSPAVALFVKAIEPLREKISKAIFLVEDALNKIIGVSETPKYNVSAIKLVPRLLKIAVQHSESNKP